MLSNPMDLGSDHLARQGVQVETGRFRETMRISSTNIGPVCILLDSQRGF